MTESQRTDRNEFASDGAVIARDQEKKLACLVLEIGSEGILPPAIDSVQFDIHLSLSLYHSAPCFM